MPVPAAGRQQAVCRNDARSWGWRDISQVRAPALAKITQGFFGKVVESTLGNVDLNLTIPQLRVEFRKPGAEGCQLGRAEPADSFFDFLHIRHDANIAGNAVGCKAIAVPVRAKQRCFELATSNFPLLWLYSPGSHATSVRGMKIAYSKD